MAYLFVYYKKSFSGSLLTFILTTNNFFAPTPPDFSYTSYF